MKEKEARIWREKHMQKRKGWDSLHTTVPANLLRNKLTSVFHIKAPIVCRIHSCGIRILFTF